MTQVTAPAETALMLSLVCTNETVPEKKGHRMTAYDLHPFTFLKCIVMSDYILLLYYVKANNLLKFLLTTFTTPNNPH